MMGELSPAEQGHNPLSQDRLRASHEDRDRVIEVLRVAAGDGRLTAEELEERVEIAFSARTYGELAALTSDLPASGQAIAPLGPAAPAMPKDLIRLEARNRVARSGPKSQEEVLVRASKNLLAVPIRRPAPPPRRAR